MFKKCVCGLCVSTHSRLKAAGGIYCACINPILSFNTQQPEGGWVWPWWRSSVNSCFNTQQPEGGWKRHRYPFRSFAVSTHSSPKAAGRKKDKKDDKKEVSTHSSPKAAGASLKSLAPSGFTAPISLSSQEKQKCEYNTAFSVASVFAIS